MIKNIFGNLDKIELSDGDIKLNLDNGIKLNSNFNSKLDLKEKFLSKYINFLNKLKISKNIKYLKADLNNNVSIELDNTYKVKDYNYRISGNIEKTQLELINPINNSFTTSEIKEIYLSNLDTKTIFNPKNTKFNVSGKYSFNNLDFFKLNLDNNYENDVENISLNFDYGSDLKLDFINYNKPNNSIANLSLSLEKKKNQTKISELNYKEKKNSIKINDVLFKKNKFHSFKKIQIFTGNNDFKIINDEKIVIKGDKFDATKLPKLISSQNKNNI